MTWNPGEDVVVVQRAPQPGAAGGTYRAFGETLRGLKTTMARLFEGPKTISYPEEKVAVSDRIRAMQPKPLEADSADLIREGRDRGWR